jgi:hypothetical protein
MQAVNYMQAVNPGIADAVVHEPFRHSALTRHSWTSVLAHEALHEDPVKTPEVYVQQQTCAAGQSLRSSQ